MMGTSFTTDRRMQATRSESAKHENAGARATVEQLRSKLAELRQQHLPELDTRRADNRAEREELRAEHREQLVDPLDTRPHRRATRR